MKKIRCRSLLGVCLIGLFLINCFLVICSLLSEHSAFSVAAILLALSQIFLYRHLPSKHGIHGPSSWGRAAQYVQGIFPFFSERRGGGDNRFSGAERDVIRARSLNKLPKSPLHDKLNEVARCGFLIPSGRLTAVLQAHLRVTIGTDQCKKPYPMSIMSAGVPANGNLSVSTIFSLSEAAKVENFTVATGFGGIQPGHVRGGGDLLWQFGLDYSAMVNFDKSYEELVFKRNSSREYVKMIEFFVDGTGRCKYGITAREREREDTEPPRADWRRSLNDLREILLFINKLREASGGKPVGIRLPFGAAGEVTSLALAMRQTGIFPDFVTIDEELCLRYSDGKGEFAADVYGLLDFAQVLFAKHNIPSALIFSGKIVTELDVLKAISHGASACISTQPMVYASKAHDIPLLSNRYSKSMRVANFQRNTLSAVYDLIESFNAKAFKSAIIPPLYHDPEAAADGIYVLASLKRGFPPIINN